MAAKPATPSWLKGAVMYSVLIDRFARGGGEPWLDPDHAKPVFCGGNLQGIIDRLGYLEELGVDALLLSPFHPTPAYHGYHVLDFYGVEPRFGTPEILKRLLDEAHSRGMRVIMDFTLSHVSREHPFFVSARTDPSSPYRRWFRFTKWPDEYVSFLNFPDLPKLDFADPEAKAHVIGAARHWLDFGLDGLRVDHVIGIPHAFLKEFRREVNSRHPGAVLIGEAVKGKIRRSELPTLHIHRKWLFYLLGLLRIPTSAMLQRQYAREMDAVFDFFFRDMTKTFLAAPAWYKPVWLLRLILRLHDAAFPRNSALIRLLDNADHDRFLFAVGGAEEKLKEAIRLQFDTRQPVMLFYGDAAGLKQTESRKFEIHGDKPHGDLAIRSLMPWDGIDAGLRDFYVELIRRRKVVVR